MADDDIDINSDETPDDQFETPPLDWALSELVDVVNGTDAEIPVILTLGGMVVHGKLVSGHQFFEAAEAPYRAAIPVTPAPEGMDHVQKLLADELQASASSFADENEDTGLAAHIHLRDATVVTGNYKLVLDYWRGRLTEVSGWATGGVGPDRS